MMMTAFCPLLNPSFVAIAFYKFKICIKDLRVQAPVEFSAKYQPDEIGVIYNIYENKFAIEEAELRIH